MKTICIALFSMFALGLGTAHADMAAIVFQQPVLNGLPGSVLSFFGALTNTTGSDIFLNADNFNISGPQPVAIDDSPFFANTPSGFLGPFDSTGTIELFEITIPSLPASGVYNGTFQLFGGETASDQTIIGSADFTAQVTPTPEPSLFWLLTAMVGVLTAIRFRSGTRSRVIRRIRE